MFGQIPTCEVRQVIQTRFMVFILSINQNSLKLQLNEYDGNHSRFFQLQDQLVVINHSEQGILNGILRFCSF